MSLRALALALALLPGPALGASLDTFTFTSCGDLDQALARGSATIAAFNTASERATEALHAGQTAEGCPLLRQALSFARRAAEGLAVCAGQVRDGSALLTGFTDLQQQIETVGRRTGCLSAAPNSDQGDHATAPAFD